MMEITIVAILIIVFIATLVRSTFGFGESLIAVPLLILFIPIKVAVPLSVLISILVAGIVVVQDHNKIHFNSAKWLILFATLGIPIGLFILLYGNEKYVKLGLGLLIILYSIYSLFGKQGLKLKGDSMLLLFVCGLFSGILGGAYGLNGPPLVIYGNLRSWSAKHFRATLQAYFLPASFIGMLGFWYKGLWSPTVTYYFLITLPVVIPTIFLGRFLNHKLKEDAFLKYIYFGLILIGLLLLI
jgi:uncharacterized membrane protein YfcA